MAIQPPASDLAPTLTPGYQRHNLPRLDPSCYRADAAILWTFTTAKRATGWLTETLHLKFRELLLHTTIRQSLLCPAYTLMPDHLHLALLGTQLSSDQRNAIACLRAHLEPLIAPATFQHQPHDHVFTQEERTKNAFAKACSYIFQNPVRANLATTAPNWPYSGCMIPRYANVTPFTDDYWPWFWKIFQKQRDPACNTHTSVHPASPNRSHRRQELAP